MAVLAGTRTSYDTASEDLRELCGIKLSDQSIRRACDGAGREAKTYLEQSPQATAAVERAQGQVEVSLDGAKVNTTEGWREIRGVLLGKRQPAAPADLRHWDDRTLPEQGARLAWAAIAEAREVGEKMHVLAERLELGWGKGVSGLADGAPWIWTQLRTHLPDHEGCLDVYHLLEHFHAAARVLHGEGDAAKLWAEQQRALLFRLGAKKYLRRQLLPAAREARRANAQSDKSQALRSLLNYLWSHRGRMGYRDRLRRGLPIGSGQIEGFCKSTLNRRLRLNNARWLPQSADHMAALCCLHTSKQWENFWSRVA